MPRKRDLKQIDAICSEFGLDDNESWKFREYLHDCKESGELGTLNSRGDFTMAELRAKAREFLGLED